MEEFLIIKPKVKWFETDWCLNLPLFLWSFWSQQSLQQKWEKNIINPGQTNGVINSIMMERCVWNVLIIATWINMENAILLVTIASNGTHVQDFVLVVIQDMANQNMVSAQAPQKKASQLKNQLINIAQNTVGWILIRKFMLNGLRDA